LADLWADFEFMPSKQWGVKVSEKRPLEEVAGFSDAVAAAEAEFAGTGRVLCRYSGTENKLRILVKGKDINLVEKHGEILAKIIEKEIGA
jgi:phosphoglucosamine mutase